MVSIKYLDTGLATIVMNFLQSIHPLKRATDSIPDLLPHFVGVCTVLMWAVYYYRSRKKVFDAETQFLRLAATVLPIAYIVKTISKFIFGRTDPRSWALHNQYPSFHWLKHWSSSFPSGHMVVFVAFGFAVLFYYPKYRRLVLVLLTLLGAALIGTDYHFLSDVIAGACVGIITTYSVWYIFEKQKG